MDETQAYRLRGVVYTFHGDLGPNRFAPLAGALVTIERIGSEETWHAETNDAGYWTKPDLPAGTYLVTVAKEGYTFNPEIHDPVINGEDLPGRCDFRAYPQD